MKKYIVLNADDFGLSVNTNKAIITSHKDGILTSTSLLVTTPGFNHAVNLIKKNPELGLGIHFSLTWGKAVSDKIKVPKLVDKDGYFLNDFVIKILLSYADKSFLEQIKIEFTNQMEKALSKGLNIDHIDSQHHIHMIPKIFSIVKHIAKSYGVKYIRLPYEKINLWPWQNGFNQLLLNLPKVMLMRYFKNFITFNNHINFYGLLHSNKMNKRAFQQILSQLSSEISEILFHPGTGRQTTNENDFDFSRQEISQYMADKMRLIELETLLDKQIKNQLKDSNIILTNFRKLKNTN